VREIIQEIENTQLVKFLFKFNLASLYSPNLILRDLLENIFFNCSAHLFECVVTHFLFLSALSLTIFECVVTLVTDRLNNSFLYKGPSSTSIKLFLVF
jgi:hypothetical protein